MAVIVNALMYAIEQLNTPVGVKHLFLAQVPAVKN